MKTPSVTEAIAPRSLAADTPSAKGIGTATPSTNITEKRVGTAVAPVKSIGVLLQESGKLREKDVDRVIKLQKKKNLRFGEAAIRLGLVRDADVQHVLAQQFDYPYLLAGERGFSSDLVAAYDPFGTRSETLRALRSRLMLQWFDENHPALALVAANPGDGSTYLTANLGVTFSQLGKRTLLVDANLRDPKLHTYFGLGNKAGLSDILVGRADFSELTAVPPFNELTVLPAGTLPPNPAELLSRDNVSDLFAVLAGHYSVILVDTPPAQWCSDFQTVASHLGGALISVRKNRTRLDGVASIKTMLRAAGIQIVGAVLDQH